jgi:hypothetical protein
MLYRCWSCRTPLSLKDHAGQALDVGECHVCGANQPLANFQSPMVWALLVGCVLFIAYHIIRGG